MNKKKCLYIVGGILLIVIIIVLILVFTKDKDNTISYFESYDNYNSNISIKVTQDNEEYTYNINIQKYEDTLMFYNSYTDYMYYIDNDKIFYLDGGRYKYFEKENNYSKLYNAVSQINPEEEFVSMDIVNNIFDILDIDLETTTDEAFNIETDSQNRIKSMSIISLYVTWYESIIITIYFSDNEATLDAPIFYEELTDEVENNLLSILDYN